ncbi:RICIN domain-containing protein [Actinoplanes teichomyceticus]|uniref:Ricin-type beta-trefoil lectin protein n=1 Tax=Actinoplanes teichomyceticus TaxID=1867 RepID=A0A561VMJ0_ACTTI|nr:RICIN domain-containing protein [Actinoplanes teichomyceticus]TWG12828.1 ricin-type beta-trefoil lectin protein [Actinoplanes teichomyceticus]GIF13573.1 hypothetical protein Ate01nite_36050 [Actinoplanes teichomyceticus]
MSVRLLRRAAIALLTVGVVLGFSAVPASANGVDQLRRQNGNVCVVVRGAAENAPAVLTTCANYADQKWNAVEHTGGWWSFHNENSGKCLAVHGTANDTQAVQTTCALSQNPDQRWWLEVFGDDLWGFRNVNSGKCLVGKGAAGGRVVQSTCDGDRYTDQRWYHGGVQL